MPTDIASWILFHCPKIVKALVAEERVPVPVSALLFLVSVMEDGPKLPIKFIEDVASLFKGMHTPIAPLKESEGSNIPV